MEIRRLGLVDYATTFEAMKVLTRERDAQTEDQLWLLQHPPVFTQGISGKPEHVLSAGAIPVVQIDRGGQVTYHGPGQWVLYTLIDLKRRGMTVRDLVTALEETVITLLAQYDITATSKPKAPGVYVSGRKIASLGLKVSRGCSYHGLAFNVDLDLAPFLQINPCGFPGLEVTSLAQLLEQSPDMAAVGEELIAAAVAQLS